MSFDFPPDFSTFQVGNVVLPLPAAEATSGGLLRDSDPTVFFALDFYTSVLAIALGARFVADCATAGVLAQNGVAITAPVMTAVPYDVTPYLGSVQYQFPILAIARKSIDSQYQERGFERDVSKVSIQYVLPPLNAAQAEAIIPIFSAVFKTLRAMTTQGRHPSYTPPGGVAGDFVWFPAFANAEEMSITSAKVGELEGEGALHFPCLLLEAFFIERDNPSSIADSATYQGSDVTVGTLSDDGGATLATPAQVIGTADVTQPSLYGAGGTLAGKTLKLNVNGAGTVTLTFAGGGVANVAALVVAIDGAWAALSAYYGGQNGLLVLVDSALGSGSSIVVGSGTANAALGLTAGTSIGADGLAPIVQLATQPAPTVASVSPSSGTQAGGTSVTITGTGFDVAWRARGASSEPQVLFGNMRATNISVVSATSITCTTPAALGNGSVSVAVFNGDGQAGDLASAFTYTTP